MIGNPYRVDGCPSCENGTRHDETTWTHHPYRGHGFNGSRWTHPDLDPPPRVVKEGDGAIPSATAGSD